MVSLRRVPGKSAAIWGQTPFSKRCLTPNGPIFVPLLSFRRKRLDQLNLTGVVNGVARDAQHEVELRSPIQR